MFKYVSLVLGLATLGAVFLLAPPQAAQGQEEEGFTNLQVLPSDIDRDDLRNLMQGQARALGVRCTHCHVRGDFASDENPKKLVAREMIRMTQAVNSQHFGTSDHRLTCWTCHRGDTTPAEPPAE